MSLPFRILFVGGSTMRGYSNSNEVESFGNQIIKELNNGSEMYAKDRILINEVRDFLEDSANFDVFVIQVGVADSLMKKPIRTKNSQPREIFPPKRPRMSKVILKRFLYFTRLSRATTKRVSFESCIESISEIVEARQAKVIWLGSVIAPVRLTKPEKLIKNHYCKICFVELAERFPETHAFIDVDKDCGDFVNDLDVFHLNQEGHNVVATLIRARLDQWAK